MKMLVSLILFIWPLHSFSQELQAEGLAAWFKSDVGLEVAAGRVTKWVDQSGKGLQLLPQNENKAPTIANNVINGLDALRFDGVDQQLTGSLGILLEGATVFCLFRYAVAESDNDYIYTIGQPSTSGSQMALSRRAGRRAYHFDGSQENFPDETCIPENIFQVSSQVYDGNQHRLYQQGVLILDTDAESAYQVDGTSMTIGNWSSGSFRFDGDLIEFIVYDRVLGESERRSVEMYLRNRAAIPETQGAGCDIEGQPQIPDYLDQTNFWIDDSGYLNCVFPDPGIDGEDTTNLYYVTWIEVECQVANGRTLVGGSGWPVVIQIPASEVPTVPWTVQVARARLDADGNITSQSTNFGITGPTRARTTIDFSTQISRIRRWLLHVPKLSGGFSAEIKLTNRHPDQSADIRLAGYSADGSFLAEENVSIDNEEALYLPVYGENGLFSAFLDQVSHVGIVDNLGDLTHASIKYTGLSSNFGSWLSETDVGDGSSTGTVFEMDGRSSSDYIDGLAVLNLLGESASVWLVQLSRGGDVLDEIFLGDLPKGGKLLSVISEKFPFEQGSRYRIEDRQGQHIQTLGLTFFRDSFFSVTPTVRQ